MCGVVGVKLSNVSQDDLVTVKNVLLQTEIRGKHASGIAWFDGNDLHRVSKPLPISELLNTFDLRECLFGDNNLTLIAHIRYSTSDILYNQPLGNSNDAFIVHNGVVTQSEPEEWKDHYGYECETRNDSELLYHVMRDGIDIEEKFPLASYSLLSLSKGGVLTNYRNGLRPQWQAKLPNGKIIASTFDILFRAGIDPDLILKVPVTNDKQTRFKND